jgi:hypothetical protein
VLENEAIAFGADTGFVAQLWETFGGPDNWRLLTNLASLEWRLASRGLPSVISPIWDQIYEFIGTASLRTLQAFLGASGALAFSQPTRFTSTLIRIRRRLDHLTSNPNEVVDDELVLAAWGGRPIQVRDVEELLPKHFAECARHDPALLETALDEIWTVARTDARATNQHPEHARRVVVDSLADLGRLADTTFPSRIVDRVRIWLQAPDAPNAVTTPLFPLAPLLAKEGSRVRLADRRTLQFEPFLVSATWARPLRDDIREVLVEQALAGDARRAGQSVKLLTDAIRSPHGRFGLEVEQDAINSWEADDLATMAALETIAKGTSSPVLRRLIRRGIEWQAQRAAMPTVQDRAHHLLVSLDQLVDDDLAETLLPLHFTSVPSQRGLRNQSLRDEDSDTNVESAVLRMERDVASRRRMAVDVVDSLWRSGISAESVNCVAQTLDEIALAREDNRDGLATLFDAVADERPAYLERLIDEVEAAQHPAMDGQLHLLLTGLTRTDRKASNARFARIGTAREGVRLATARMFNSCGPEQRAELRELRQHGMSDESEPVRQEYLASMGPDLMADVSATATTLLSQGANADSVQRVLLDTWRIDEAWFSERDAHEAAKVISLIVVSGRTSWIAQHLLTSLAPRHLPLILDSLTQHVDIETLSRHDIERDLMEEIRSQPNVVADWIVGKIRSGTDTSRLAPALEFINGEGFAQPLGEAIAHHVPLLTGKQVGELVKSLANSHGWAASCPTLARAILTSGPNGKTARRAAIEAGIKDGTRPHHWIGSNGESAELNAALAANESAAAVETNQSLRAIFEDAVAILRATIEQDRLRFQEDEDED